MFEERLYYRKGYKIQTENDLSIKTDIFPEKSIQYFRHGHLYITLLKNGVLIVHAGYASDLASGPTFNTKSSRRGAVLHDGLYELIRQGLLDMKWREPSDILLFRVTIRDGMWEWRAKMWYKGLQIADGKAALPKNKKKILVAP